MFSLCYRLFAYYLGSALSDLPMAKESVVDLAYEMIRNPAYEYFHEKLYSIHADRVQSMRLCIEYSSTSRGACQLCRPCLGTKLSFTGVISHVLVRRLITRSVR